MQLVVTKVLIDSNNPLVYIFNGEIYPYSTFRGVTKSQLLALLKQGNTLVNAELKSNGVVKLSDEVERIDFSDITSQVHNHYYVADRSHLHLEYLSDGVTKVCYQYISDGSPKEPIPIEDFDLCRKVAVDYLRKNLVLDDISYETCVINLLYEDALLASYSFRNVEKFAVEEMSSKLIYKTPFNKECLSKVAVNLFRSQCIMNN